MALLEVLTIVFVVLKLTGTIDWSWWLVLLPEIIAVGIYLVFVLAMSVTSFSISSSYNRK